MYDWSRLAVLWGNMFSLPQFTRIRLPCLLHSSILLTNAVIVITYDSASKALNMCLRTHDWIRLLRCSHIRRWGLYLWARRKVMSRYCASTGTRALRPFPFPCLPLDTQRNGSFQPTIVLVSEWHKNWVVLKRHVITFPWYSRFDF